MGFCNDPLENSRAGADPSAVQDEFDRRGNSAHIQKVVMQVTLIQRDHMIEQIAPATSHPVLCHPFCQGLLNEVLTDASSIDCMAESTSFPNLASRSKIRCGILEFAPSETFLGTQSNSRTGS